MRRNIPVTIGFWAADGITPLVTGCGRICLRNKKINFSRIFAGQAVGIKEVHGDIWLASFMEYDLRYFDLETRALEPLENPFCPKVLPMSPVRSVTYVSGPDPRKNWSRGRDLNPRPADYESAALPLSYLGESDNGRVSTLS